MAGPLPEKLSRREREIMDAIFALPDPVSAENIRGRLTDPPSYSAVRAMLSRLERKGYIRHREEGLRYVYSATMPRGLAGRAALRQLVRVFFGGSPGEAATARADAARRAVEKRMNGPPWWLEPTRRRPLRRAPRRVVETSRRNLPVRPRGPAVDSPLATCPAENPDPFPVARDHR